MFFCEQVYCVVRSKKGKIPEDRLQELFKSPIFRLLQPNLPNLRHKVQLVNADLAEPNCGLAPADQELLVRCAAAADISQQYKTCDAAPCACPDPCPEPGCPP